MSLQNPIPGFNFTAEYQISGIPWVTSSIVSGVTHHRFETVARSITVKNVSGAATIRVAFTENGLSSNHYFELSTGESIAEELRATDLWVSGSGNTVSVLAGLTLIPTATLGFRMTGSQGTVTGVSIFEGMG